MIEDGFYYDFQVEPFNTRGSLASLEAEMKRLAEADWPVLPVELDPGWRVEQFMTQEEPLKVELVAAIPEGERLTGYRQGDFFYSAVAPMCPAPAG